MPMDRKKYQQLQNEVQDLFMQIEEIFPPEYRFTLVARSGNMVYEDDMVLTNDVTDDVIDTLRRLDGDLKEVG